MEWSSNIPKRSSIITAWTPSATPVKAAEVFVDTLPQVMPSSAFVGMVSTLAPTAIATAWPEFGVPVVLNPTVSLFFYFIIIAYSYLALYVIAQRGWRFLDTTTYNDDKDSRKEFCLGA